MTDENLLNNEETEAAAAAEETIDAAAETAQAPAQEDEALADELESLRDTFQNVLDETTAEAEKQPVIQELDYRADEVSAEQSEDAPAETEETKKSAKVKKEKKHRKALIIIPIVLCVLIIIPLLAYFIITIKVPDFNNFASAYLSASSAATPAERVTAYESALEYCGDDSFLAAFKQEILENIVTATCESSGYSAAYQYMTENITDEMKAAPVTKEFKEFLTIGDQLNGIADTAFAKVIEAVGDKTDDKDVDYDAIIAALGVSELIKDNVKTALGLIGAGAAAENTAVEKEDVQDAMASYLNAYSAFSELGADCTGMLESIITKLYGYGYAYESQLLIDQYMKDAEETENEEFKAVKDDLAALKAYDADIFAAAKKQFEAGKFTETELAKAMNTSSLSESAAKAAVQIALTAAQAMEAKEAHNLTKASAYYTSVIGALTAFEFPTAEAGAEAIAVLIDSGDTQTANSVKTSVFGEDKEIPESAKPVTDELDKLYNAQYAANEAFYPFYYNASYYGAEMKKDEIIAALDKLITEKSNEYDKAFVEYYKYLAEAFTDADKDEMSKHLNAFAEAMKDYPMLYGYAVAQLYHDNDEYDKAAEVADKMLAVNADDDFANSVKAFALRQKKDIDGALSAARKGMELSQATEYCAYEAAIDLLLKGEYEECFEIAKKLYAANLTTNYCELIKIIEALYKDASDEVKEELAGFSAEIDETYSTYGVEASDDAKGILDGTLTPEDVFLDGNYDLG